MIPRIRLIVPIALVAMFLPVCRSNTHAQVVYDLQHLPAGTRVVDPKADRWNTLVLLAQPFLASGDIDRLPAGVSEAVSRFSYTVMATVVGPSREPTSGLSLQKPDASVADRLDTPQITAYRLAEVGVGYSDLIEGRSVIVRSDDESMPQSFGLIDRQVLSQNERDLENARVVVRSSTLILFDMKTIVARESGHQQEPIRTLVWLDPQTGKSALAMWLLRSQNRQAGDQRSLASTPEFQVTEDPMQIHSSGRRAKNRIHVDAGTFMLGVPTARTFALEHLLPGHPIHWSEQLGELAGQSNYSNESLQLFSVMLNQAMKSSLSQKTQRSDR